jgi:hypothetical protein
MWLDKRTILGETLQNFLQEKCCIDKSETERSRVSLFLLIKFSFAAVVCGFLEKKSRKLVKKLEEGWMEFNYVCMLPDTSITRARV